MVLLLYVVLNQLCILNVLIYVACMQTDKHIQKKNHNHHDGYNYGAFFREKGNGARPCLFYSTLL